MVCSYLLENQTAVFNQMQDWHGLIELVQLSLKIKIMIVDFLKNLVFLMPNHSSQSSIKFLLFLSQELARNKHLQRTSLEKYLIPLVF